MQDKIAHMQLESKNELKKREEKLNNDNHVALTNEMKLVEKRNQNKLEEQEKKLLENQK